MSHEWESGFVVREAAWHGLATVLDAPPTTAEGLKLAGLDWRVNLAPLTAWHSVDDGGTDRVIAVESHKAVVRGTDEAILGVVGADYVPVQNADAMAFFDPLIARGDVELESAGSLKGGRRVWVLAKMHSRDGTVGDSVSEGDPVVPYLLVSTAHDGTRAVTVAFTPIRVVCWNTLSAAERRSDRGVGASVRIRHVGQPAEALAEVSAFVDASRRTFAASLEEWRAMRARGIDVKGLERYVRRVFREEEDTDALRQELAIVEAELAKWQSGGHGSGYGWGERDQERVAFTERRNELDLQLSRGPRAFEAVERLFHEGPGAQLAGKTVWGAFNAVTHWVDHVRGRSADSRLDASWFGVGAQVRGRARSEALALI